MTQYLPAPGNTFLHQQANSCSSDYFLAPATTSSTTTTTFLDQQLLSAPTATCLAPMTTSPDSQTLPVLQQQSSPAPVTSFCNNSSWILQTSIHGTISDQDSPLIRFSLSKQPCVLMRSYLPQPPFYFFLPFTDSLKQKYLYNTKTLRMYNGITVTKQEQNFQCKRTSKFKKHWYENKSNSFQFRVLFF